MTFVMSHNIIYQLMVKQHRNWIPDAVSIRLLLFNAYSCPDAMPTRLMWYQGSTSIRPPRHLQEDVVYTETVPEIKESSHSTWRQSLTCTLFHKPRSGGTEPSAATPCLSVCHGLKQKVSWLFSVCACLHACVRACVRACARARARVCVYVCVCVCVCVWLVLILWPNRSVYWTTPPAYVSPCLIRHHLRYIRTRTVLQSKTTINASNLHIW